VEHNAQSTPDVLVTGDCHTYYVLAPTAGERGGGRIHLFGVPGGAHLLYQAVRVALGEQVAVSGAAPTVTVQRPPEALIEFETVKDYSRRKEDPTAWRMRRGWGWTSARPAPCTWALPTASTTLIVVSDRATGAREEWLEGYLSSASPSTLIVDSRHPHHRHSLLRALDGKGTAAGCVVAVVHASDMRDTNPRGETPEDRETPPEEETPLAISVLSHERAAMQLLMCLHENTPKAKTMQAAQHVLVVLGSSAVAWCARQTSGKTVSWRVRLFSHCDHVYDAPLPLEDRVGHTTLLTASITQAFVDSPPDSSRNESFDEPIGRGIRAAITRCLLYDDRGLSAPDASTTIDGVEVSAGWCRQLLGTSINDEDARRTIVERTVSDTPAWSLLTAWCTDDGTIETAGKAALHVGALSLATMIVRRGLDVARKTRPFPLARFGKWTGVDLEEIEGYLSLRRLMRKYLHKPTWTRPLSLAAFGPPGSGKSFGIREMASDLRAEGVLAKRDLEFNMGEFSGVDDLLRALHMSRDQALSGRVPLVMFDEFDAAFEGRSHGWLKYLLAPTQDGRFREEGIEFHVGRAIFVFVGGTSPTFDELAAQMSSRPFIEAKGPDFVSRLRGHVNVRGPDRAGAEDELFVVRRAVILRGLLEEQFGRDVSLAPGVVRAFLTVPEYRHGVRSLQAIVEMSDFRDPENQFVESSLPPPDQLNMHTDAVRFLELVRGDRL
jgi:hypothetical protein